MQYHPAMSSARAVTAVRLSLLFSLAVLLSGGSCSWKFESDHDDDDDRDKGGTIIVVEEATFGGWDVAPRLRDRPGVVSATGGWNGGALPFLGAEWAGWTGHRRVTRVSFDPAAGSFEDLLAAVRAERADEPRVTVYAHTDAQRQSARTAFPAESLPRLRLRTAGDFTPAR